MTLDAVAEAAAPHGLAVLGAFHPTPDDAAQEACGTLVLLGPDGPGFWAVFCAAAEYRDGAADPIDRWSRRIIDALAARLDARALYPFGGPPHQPFPAWAKRTGQAWASPVGLLVHATAGLFVSYRGALAFGGHLALPAAAPRPCDSCDAPCRVACPVAALSPAGYDVPACHGYLGTTPGQDCLNAGCVVRRSCPVGRGLRLAAQSAFHMARFHGTERTCDA